MDPEQISRRLRRGMLGAQAIIGTAYVILMGLAIWQLWQASSTGRAQDWQQFWWIHWLAWGAALFFLLTLPPGFSLAWVARPEVSRTLVQAILEGDARVAPLAAGQPAPLENGELRSEPVDFGPFPPPVPSPTGGLVLPGMPPFLGRIFLPAILVLDVFTLGPLAVLNRHSLYGWLVELPALGAAVATALAAVASIWIYALVRHLSARAFTRQRRHGVRLVADHTELRLSFVGQVGVQRNIAWREARALCMSRLPRTMSIFQGTHYMVATGERVLTWWITPATTPAALVDHEHLCRLIVTRTGLPLRDVSALGADLARPSFNARAPALEARLAGIIDPAAMLGRRRRKRTLIAIALAPVVLAALLSIAGLVLQHVRAG